LTVLPGGGQFRGSSGMITREAAMFVILHYPAGEKDSSIRIEEIRDIIERPFSRNPCCASMASPASPSDFGSRLVLNAVKDLS
jgi:hypothetical protein